MSEAFRALRTSLLLSQAGSSAAGHSGDQRAAARRQNNCGGEPRGHAGATGRQDAAGGRGPAQTRRRPAAEHGHGKYAGLSSYLAGVSRWIWSPCLIPRFRILPRFRQGRCRRILPTCFRRTAERRPSPNCGTRYKFIVIDSPPIMAATDAVILSVQVDGVLLVVRSGETPKEAFTRTRDLLVSVKSRLLGVVLNAVDSSAPDYYYSYRYYPYSIAATVRRKPWNRSQEERPTATSSLRRRSGRFRQTLRRRMLRYLITGGAGFIGSHLAERLLERGDKVVMMDNLSTGSMENIRHLKSYDSLEYHPRRH